MGGINDQIHETSVRQLSALLEAQSNLRRVAEKDARASRKAMERIAEGVVPEEVNRLRERDPAGLAVMPPDQIANLVLVAIGRLKSQVLDLRQRIVLADDPENERATSPPSNEPGPLPPGALAPSMPVAPSAPPALPNPPPPPPASDVPPWLEVEADSVPEEHAVPLKAWPGWAKEWHAKHPRNFERHMDVVVVLDDTGIARRQDLSVVLGQRWGGITPDSGSIGRVLRSQRDLGIIKLVTTKRQSQAGWLPGHLVQLTERGEDAYCLFRGEDPIPSQTAELLNRHKSPAHAALNIESAGALWEAGYKVELFPDPVELDEGTFRPDLAAVTPEGEHLYVECERATYKDPDARQRKWDLYYTASAGHFAIITPDAASSETIRDEILTWADGRPLTLRVTDMEQMTRQEGDFWAFVERVG